MVSPKEMPVSPSRRSKSNEPKTPKEHPITHSHSNTKILSNPSSSHSPHMIPNIFPTNEFTNVEGNLDIWHLGRERQASRRLKQELFDLDFHTINGGLELRCFVRGDRARDDRTRNSTGTAKGYLTVFGIQNKRQKE